MGHVWSERAKVATASVGGLCLFIAGKYGALTMERYYIPIQKWSPVVRSGANTPALGSQAPAFFLAAQKSGDGELVVFGDCESCAAVPPSVLERVPPGRPIVAVRPPPPNGEGQGVRRINGYVLREQPASTLAPFGAEFTPRIFRYRHGRLVSIQPALLYPDRFAQELSR